MAPEISENRSRHGWKGGGLQASLSSYEGQTAPALPASVGARGGHPLSTASRLGPEVGLETCGSLRSSIERRTSPLDTLDLLLGGDRLQRSFRFPETAPRGFNRRKSTDPGQRAHRSRSFLAQCCAAVGARWVIRSENLAAGFSSPQVQTTRNYRSTSKLSDFVTGVFGHYPCHGCLGSPADLTHERDACRSADSGFVALQQGPAPHIPRHGIPTAAGVEIRQRRGFRSRRLAVLAADAYLASGDSGGIRAG